jgi:hypothetical protein
LSLCCCFGDDTIVSWFTAFFSAAIIKDSQSNQRALILIHTFWIMSCLARNVLFHCPLFRVSLKDSFNRSLAHTPMLLTWFGVFGFFAGSNKCSPLKVLYTLLIGVVTDTYLRAFHHVQTHKDRPNHTSKWHGSTKGCMRCWLCDGLHWQ